MTTRLPKLYLPLPGSERHPLKKAKLLGPADDLEIIKLTIVLRRRCDGSPIPEFDYFIKTPLEKRKRLDTNEFAEKYGAHPDDINKVVFFAKKFDLKVVETNLARRTVVVSGTIGQISKAFVVKLARYRQIKNNQVKNPNKIIEIYRGRDGFINIPEALIDIIIGVFGLDNRNISNRNFANPSNTAKLTVQKVTQLYNFPTNSATGQTIAIFSLAGYLNSDIKSNFLGHPPKIIDVKVNASNNKSADRETTQDICIAAKAAPGATIAVYFTTDDESGWVNLINRVIHPDNGDPNCSVLSCSFYVLEKDDLVTLPVISSNWIKAMTMAFQDAAVQGVTVCIASGDAGTDSNVGDGHAHVQYPASDPWVLSVGGTTISNVNGNSFDEYLWNDKQIGATGGGISGYFSKPSYQNNKGIPSSLNGGNIGRGVPDVAANADPNSCYEIIIDGTKTVGNGTSASTPLWAGLIALINAALNKHIGFVNPYIYNIGSKAFRDILATSGLTNNGFNGVAGYPAELGWDACTGWGSPNGEALLTAFQNNN